MYCQARNQPLAWHRGGGVRNHAQIEPVLNYSLDCRPSRVASAGKYTLPYFQVQRAKMILYAAEGMPNDEMRVSGHSP